MFVYLEFLLLANVALQPRSRLIESLLLDFLNGETGVEAKMG